MAPFDHDTTAEEIANECASRIVNKTILVTGASPGGLGAAFATIVAKYGPAAIVLATRDISKAEETARDVTTVAPNVRTHAIELDLSSIEQVRKAAEKINSLDEHIDVIVNNAGIMAPPYSETVDGIESQFATNHVGHFLLTNLMLPKILAEKRPVRVVSVTSGGFRFGPPRFEDWNFDVRDRGVVHGVPRVSRCSLADNSQDGKAYNRWKAYGQSKSANMLFSVALARKLGRRGLVSAALHPGVIQTGLARNLDMSDIEEFGKFSILIYELT